MRVRILQGLLGEQKEQSPSEALFGVFSDLAPDTPLPAIVAQRIMHPALNRRGEGSNPSSGTTEVQSGDTSSWEQTSGTLPSVTHRSYNGKVRSSYKRDTQVRLLPDVLVPARRPRKRQPILLG